jgi:putative transposase
VVKSVTRCRTFRYRLHPTFRQSQSLVRQLDYQCELYNAALEERISAWRLKQYSVTYFDQCRTLTGLQEFRPEVLSSGVRLCRGTLKRIDRAFTGFHGRVRRGETPGYPRFKSRTQFTSLQWEDPHGWNLKLNDRRILLPGIGEVKANFHRPPSGIPKAITVKQEGKKWWVSVRCAEVPANPLKHTGREIGIDLGVKNLVATSDGDLYLSKRFGSKSAKRISEAREAVSRSHPDSNRRSKRAARVAELHRKVANQRRDAAHQLSRTLVNEFDFLAIEDLEISQMVRYRGFNIGRGTPRHVQSSIASRLHRSIYDAGWGILLSMLLYKAESAGRVVVKVDPRHTSQTCAECGHVDARNRVSQSMFRCAMCGHQDHADVNAARNILRAGRAQQAAACEDHFKAATLYPRSEYSFVGIAS